MESNSVQHRAITNTKINANEKTDISPASVFAVGSLREATSVDEKISPRFGNTVTDNSDPRLPSTDSSNNIELSASLPENHQTQSEASHEGFLMGSVKAMTGLATRLTISALETATPYLSAAADTAYQTAKAQSPLVQRLEQSALETVAMTKEVRTMGNALIADAEKSQKHLETIKSERAAAQAASATLKKSSRALLSKIALNGTAATACVAGLRALPHLLAKGSTSLAGRPPFVSVSLGTAALAGSALALCSSEGVAFYRAAAQMTNSLFSGSSAGIDAATELADNAISTQIRIGTMLSELPGYAPVNAEPL